MQLPQWLNFERKNEDEIIFYGVPTVDQVDKTIFIIFDIILLEDWKPLKKSYNMMQITITPPEP